MAVASGQRRAPTPFDVDAELRALGDLLGEHAVELSDAIARHLVSEIPELAGDGDEQAIEETRDSTQANLDAIAAMLRFGHSAEEVEPPLEAVEFARSLVRHGIELSALLRCYRLGHAYVWRWWTQEASARLERADALAAVLDASSVWMFEYVDRVCARLVEEYGAERARWARTAAALRADTVRSVLAGEPVDIDAASLSLGYELRRTHVALVAWLPPEDRRAGAVERALAHLCKGTAGLDPLVVPAGGLAVWAWVGASSVADLEPLVRAVTLEGADGVRFAIGAPGGGIEGFRRSHEEARHAQNVATLGDQPGGAVTHYRSVALTSLLAADLERARRFCASELGGLAAIDEVAARLRATLKAYLEAGGSHLHAARKLGIHANTVAYRIRRAEEMLGHAPDMRRLELGAALELAEAIGPAVLGSLDA